ncbi:MAG: hypothetical protein GY845_02930 [Planctomycetes bacterium]|nr:hypothetical protein [Planctomycetota bacterium]
MGRNNDIGDFGEQKVIKFLESQDYSSIFMIANSSGQGLDIIAMKTYYSRGEKLRYIVSIEVKTTTSTGSGPRTSKAQKEAYLNTGKILIEAAQGTGRFNRKKASPRNKKSANLLLSAHNQGVPIYPVLARIQISNTTNISKSSVKRVRIHSAYNAATYSRKPIHQRRF